MRCDGSTHVSHGAQSWKIGTCVVTVAAASFARRRLLFSLLSLWLRLVGEVIAWTSFAVMLGCSPRRLALRVDACASSLCRKGDAANYCGDVAISCDRSSSKVG